MCRFTLDVMVSEFARGLEVNFLLVERGRGAGSLGKVVGVNVLLFFPQELLQLLRFAEPTSVRGWDGLSHVSFGG